jgi:oxygen-dependent protoporphyrinogen oxidase
MGRVQRNVVVVGGGISGLAIAHELKRRVAGRDDLDLKLTCLEAGAQPGGNIRTDRVDGFVCEWGPTGFLDNAPATLELARKVGLGPRLLPAGPQAESRYIYRAGKLRRVPLSPGAFLTSSILPLWGRLRVLGEPLAGRPPRGHDQSVREFASRRIGPQAAAVLVDAMVSGVYAGDAARLSLQATFPKMHDMESRHGSLFRAMLAKRKEARARGVKAGGPAGPGGRLTSFPDGLQELTDALAASLGDRLQTGTPVQAVSDMGDRGFRVHRAEGVPLETDAVVLAVPAWHAADALRQLEPPLAAVLDEIPSAPVVVVHCGFSGGALGTEPEGFGFLVPRGQGPRILGSLWISSIFPGRAPKGHVLMTTMIGGAHDPEALELDDDAIVRIVRQDLGRVMNLVANPYFVSVMRHPRGIPQYTLGHMERLERIDGHLARHPGLWLSGNSYRGISVNACVEEAPRVAAEVLDHLAPPATSGAAPAR